MLPEKSSVCSWRGMNACMDIWKPSANAALTLLFHKQSILTTKPFSVHPKPENWRWINGFTEKRSILHSSADPCMNQGLIWSLQNTTGKGVYRAFMGNLAEPFTRRAGQKGHYNCICGKLLSGKWIQGSVQSKILWWTWGRIYLFPIGKKYRYRLHPLHKTY